MIGMLCFVLMLRQESEYFGLVVPNLLLYSSTTINASRTSQKLYVYIHKNPLWPADLLAAPPSLPLGVWRRPWIRYYNALLSRRQERTEWVGESKETNVLRRDSVGDRRTESCGRRLSIALFDSHRLGSSRALGMCMMGSQIFDPGCHVYSREGA